MNGTTPLSRIRLSHQTYWRFSPHRLPRLASPPYHGRCSDELKSVIPPKRALRVARVSPIPNTLSRSNWKSAGPLHSLIRLSPWLQRTGTPSLPPSFPAPIIFKPSNLVAQTPTPTLSHLINFLFSSKIFQGFKGTATNKRLRTTALHYGSWWATYVRNDGHH